MDSLVSLFVVIQDEEAPKPVTMATRQTAKGVIATVLGLFQAGIALEAIKILLTFVPQLVGMV